MQLLLAFLVILTIGAVSYILTVLCQNTFLYIYDAGRNVVHNIVVLKTASLQLNKAPVIQNENEVFKDSIGKQTVLIDPNPTRGALRIEIQGYQQDIATAIYLFDYSGKLLQTKNSTDNTFSLDLSPYAPGTYVLKIILGDRASDWKIIKE